MERETYQIRLGEQTFTLDGNGTRVFRDGTALPLSVAEVSQGRFSVILDGRSVTVSLEDRSQDAIAIRADHHLRRISWLDRRAALLASMGYSGAAESRHNEVRAPMPGLVLDIMVEPGQAVQAGDGLVVLEAMKMENELRAGADGVVSSIHVVAGDAVGKNAILIELDA